MDISYRCLDETVELYTCNHLSQSQRESLEIDLRLHLYDASNRMYQVHEMLTPAHELTSEVVLFLEQMVTGEGVLDWPELRAKLDRYFGARS